MNHRAQRMRDGAINRAVIEIVGKDGLDEYPDLPYALDEILSAEDDHTIEYLAIAAANAEHAEDAATEIRREDDRDRGDMTDAEEQVSRLDRAASDALKAYVEQRARARIEDATEWISSDITLDELDLDRGESDE